MLNRLFYRSTVLIPVSYTHLPGGGTETLGERLVTRHPQPTLPVAALDNRSI